MKCKENTLYNVPSKIVGTRLSVYELAYWKNGVAFKKRDFSKDGVPIIKIAELNNGISASTAFTKGNYSQEVFLTKGDIVFSWSGNPHTSIDVYKYNLPNGWLNQHIFKVTANENIIIKDYLFFLLKHLKPHFIQIATNKQTVGLGHITIEDLKKMSVIIPEKKVQGKIVSILKPIDDRIELNKQINNNLS